jgi:RNA polymerase sigma-70 factor (ECF subfamily)
MDTLEDAYRRFGESVFRFTWRLVGRRPIAEEITADVFVSLLQNRESVRLDELPAWLYTVARHRAMDYWRRHAVEDRFTRTLPADPVVAPSDAAALALFDHRGLKPVHRACLKLRYGSGMSVVEVAEALGLSENQVKGYLQYARERLRADLTTDSR